MSQNCKKKSNVPYCMPIVVFFFKLWYGEFGDFFPNYLAKLFKFTLERQISPNFFGFACPKKVQK